MSPGNDIFTSIKDVKKLKANYSLLNICYYIIMQCSNNMMLQLPAHPWHTLTFPESHDCFTELFFWRIILRRTGTDWCSDVRTSVAALQQPGALLCCGWPVSRAAQEPQGPALPSPQHRSPVWGCSCPPGAARSSQGCRPGLGAWGLRCLLRCSPLAAPLSGRPLREGGGYLLLAKSRPLRGKLSKCLCVRDN
uniref:Uncharacterized protein n=1 Tax=Dromaius novaehollandiae TaxID=8790 RepID=A0A8C4JU60_DRONO